MLLTITTTHQPATDLGYLLHKNPARLHSFALPFGEAHVFYPEATDERCTAALLVEARHDPEIVLARARADLSEQFSFAARAFGQLVSLSEVTTALQNVSGVVAVDVNQLYKEGETALLNPYLTADAPQSGAPPDALAAELLTLAPESLAKVTVQP